MSGALFVSNPRKRRSKRSRNPATGGGWYAGGFNDLFDAAPSRTSVLAEDVARIIKGQKPMSKAERQVARLLAQAKKLESRASRATVIQGMVDANAAEADGKIALELALRRARRAAGLGSSSKRKRKASKRRASRRGTRRMSRRSNPFMGLDLGALTLSNPRKRRKGGKRRGSKSRRYSRPRSSKGQFVSRRRGARGRRRNGLTLSNPMSGIPVIGTMVGMIGPAAFGAVGVELIGQVGSFAKRYVTVPEMVAPFEYSIGGLILAGVVQLITPIPAPIRHSLGVGLASAGGAVDWYRYRSASGAYGALEFGDGGSWAVEYGDDEAYGALEFGDIDFSGEEDFAGLDFSMAEGEAAAEGYGAYAGRFPLKKHPKARSPRLRAKPGMKPHQVHQPGAEGDRWHWLAAAVGPDDFKRIANMPPEQRLGMIQKCKDACKGAMSASPVGMGPKLLAVNNIEGGSMLPDPRSLAVPFANDQFAI